MKSWHVAAPVMAGLLLGAALTFAPAVSQAEDSATIVHERQQLMKDFGSAMKTIGGYLQGGIGTTDDVAAAAGVIAEGAASLPDHFPAGTSMDDVMDPKTGAKPVIWEQWDQFVTDSQTLEARATAVQELAMAMDDAALGDAFQALGNDGCGSCHKTFREKLE
jgi:cytochrome c556